MPGRIADLGGVPDPVFAGAMVGPGLAIDPGSPELSVAVAPVDGVLTTVHPHAFVVLADEGRPVLVHLGIDTVELRGSGFTTRTVVGERVHTGTPVVSWSPLAVLDGGRSAMVPVIALDAAGHEVELLAEAGDDVEAGDAILRWVS